MKIYSIINVECFISQWLCLLQYSGYNVDASAYECTAYGVYPGPNDLLYSYAYGVVPLQAEPLLTWSGASPTSIITLTERSYTVAVVGTEDGQLLKVCILILLSVLNNYVLIHQAIY